MYKKKVFITVLNKTRDFTQRAAGDSKFHRMGAACGKEPVSVRPESCLGHTLQTAVPRADRVARLVPLQQTAEMLRSQAVQGLIREDQDAVVHTDRHWEPL